MTFALHVPGPQLQPCPLCCQLLASGAPHPAGTSSLQGASCREHTLAVALSGGRHLGQKPSWVTAHRQPRLVAFSSNPRLVSQARERKARTQDGREGQKVGPGFWASGLNWTPSKRACKLQPPPGVQSPGWSQSHTPYSQLWKEGGSGMGNGAGSDLGVISPPSLLQHSQQGPSLPASPHHGQV